MAHVKREDVTYSGHISPDADSEARPWVEASEEKKDGKGESLWRSLHERHINMIAFSGTVGNGLFLGSGASIASAGPGGAVLAYVLIGTVMSSVISCLGEMTALMPVNAPMMEFPRRFLDRGVGFAVGWMYWFAYAVIAANQLVAASNAIKFQYDDGTTRLFWQTGIDVDHAIWFATLLIGVTIVNLFPVRAYGELEYMFGLTKMLVIVMSIVMFFVLGLIPPKSEAYYDAPLKTKYWDSPYSFFNTAYTIKNSDGTHRTITGSVGSLVGVWSTLISVAFSYTGMDIFAATAAESRILANPDAMKMAARKIVLRIITLYSICVLMTSFLVPSDNTFIGGEGQSVGARSIFLVAVVRAGLPKAAQFYNAVFLFSSFTCAICSMYNASRVLHTLALRGQTGPEFITKRLRECRVGVPTRTVLVTATMMIIGFMGRTGDAGERLQELEDNCTVSFLIVYATICGTYLCFYKTLKDAKAYGNTSESQAATYDRDSPTYPYKSHGQWLKACYGLVGCVLLIFFNGIETFLQTPFPAHTFISRYISLPVFFLLIAGYKIRNHGFRFSEWGLERSEDLSNTVQVTSVKRKGKLQLPDDAYVTKQNGIAFARWVWEWLK